MDQEVGVVEIDGAEAMSGGRQRDDARAAAEWRSPFRYADVCPTIAFGISFWRHWPGGTPWWRRNAAAKAYGEA